MTEVAIVASALAAFDDADERSEDGNEATTRVKISAYARHVSDVLGHATPSAFRDDPPTPKPIATALRSIEKDACTIDSLGWVFEELLDSADRRSQGAHFTPRAVVDRVVDLALSRKTADGPIWDPSCGGGAFLLGACRWLERHESALPRTEIVARTFASDIDEIALDVCDATLEMWSGGEVRPATTAVDALLDLPPSWPHDFAAVLGNPPFLSQLSSDTTRTNERRARLTKHFAAAEGAYADEAALFVELAVARTRAGGVVGLVVPQSMLASRDSGPLRSYVERHAELDRLWLDAGQSFDAAVDVAALVLRLPAESSEASPRPAETEVHSGLDSATVRLVVETPTSASWGPLVAAAMGVPAVRLPEGAVLGDVAHVTAGFRQHFYGIADAVEESGSNSGCPRLVTAGAIEPLRSLWGTRMVKFAGQRWTSPVLRCDSIDDDAVRDWFVARQVPKILLASQTRVLEAVADPSGNLVPSVPVVSVEPQDSDLVWHLAAALSAPCTSAWMLGHAAGTGLSHDAIRVRAATLAGLPLPSNEYHWDEGARLAELAQAAADEGEFERHVDLLGSLAVAMNAAYGVEDRVGDWWWERLRLPTASNAAASTSNRRGINVD